MAWDCELLKELQEFTIRLSSTGSKSQQFFKTSVLSAQRLTEDEQDHPTVAELDELQTYVGRKIDKIWLWTAINHHAPGILAIEVGDRSGQTFAKLTAENSNPEKSQVFNGWVLCLCQLYQPRTAFSITQDSIDQI